MWTCWRILAQPISKKLTGEAEHGGQAVMHTAMPKHIPAKLWMLSKKELKIEEPTQPFEPMTGTMYGQVQKLVFR
jgi:hypothetical protein